MHHEVFPEVDSVHGSAHRLAHLMKDFDGYGMILPFEKSADDAVVGDLGAKQRLPCIKICHSPVPRKFVIQICSRGMFVVGGRLVASIT